MFTKTLGNTNSAMVSKQLRVLESLSLINLLLRLKKKEKKNGGKN